MTQFEEDIQEYEVYLKTVFDLRGKGHEKIPRIIEGYRKRQSRVLTAGAPAPRDREPRACSEPLWDVLFTRRHGNAFLQFVAYLAIHLGSMPAVREHFRTNRFTLWEWMNAERKRQSGADKSSGRLSS